MTIRNARPTRSAARPAAGRRGRRPRVARRADAAHHRAHLRQRDEYLAIAERGFRHGELDQAARMRYLILRAGIGLEEYWLSWLDEAIAEVSELSDGPTYA